MVYNNKLKFKLLRTRAALPQRMTDGSAGLDLYAIEDGCIMPGQVEMIPLGLAVEIPVGYVGILVGRSSHGKNYGAGVPQGFGTIDSDYRGELVMMLRADKSMRWKNGDRIGQMLIVPCALWEPVAVEVLRDTIRGTGGFGSTNANEQLASIL